MKKLQKELYFSVESFFIKKLCLAVMAIMHTLLQPKFASILEVTKDAYNEEALSFILLTSY